MPAVETVQTEAISLQYGLFVIVGHGFELGASIQRMSLTVAEDTVVVDGVRVGSNESDSPSGWLLVRG